MARDAGPKKLPRLNWRDRLSNWLPGSRPQTGSEIVNEPVVGPTGCEVNKRNEQGPVAKDTAEHRLAPVDSGLQGCAPVDTDADDCSPLVLGSMRSAKEHAELIVEIIRQHGPCGQAIYVGDLERLHSDMCEDLAWLPKGWPAVCRELAKLPGVKRGQVKVEGQRLTAYEIEPAAEAANVVSLGVSRR